LLNWSDSIGIGARALLLRRLRSLLSTLGIVFGVGAVISMMAIGEGAKREAIEQVKLLGTNNIRVKRIELTGARREEAAQRSAQGLTYEDALVLGRRLPSPARAAPLKFIEADVHFGGRQAIAAVIGTSPQYEEVTSFRVFDGRFLTDLDLRDYKRVCVLGSEIKEEIFGYRDAVGATVHIGEERFTVVGTMEPKNIREGRATVIKLRNINRDVYIPITSAMRRFSSAEDPFRIDELAVRLASSDALSRTATFIQDLLREAHNGVEDFEVMIPEELLAQARRTQRLFGIIMGSIAGIALLVGGIGIMNIMLANVSERTREIGIRRAVGATRRDILGQFLIETVMVCLVGGAIGILFGFGLATVITAYAKWQTAFSFASVIIAVGTSVTVGLIFGLFPARRAADLDPVTALRIE
jgi:putative ABC transport system permease protein